MTSVRTCLWFDGSIEEAAALYTSLVPGSELGSIVRVPEGSPFPGAVPGAALTVDLTIGGVPYQLLNGGPHFQQSEAASIVLEVDGQAEVDRLWATLTEGGQESQCGWCKDRFGVSWQVVPAGIGELLSGPNAPAVSEALMTMQKIDLARLQAAAAG